METTNSTSDLKVDKLVRIAIISTMAGMIFVLLFLIFGFRAWTVGLGVFIGMPVMFFGVLLYVVAVLRDLKNKRVLVDDHQS